MIQPVNVLTPQMAFRGSNKSFGKLPPNTNYRIALINSSGIASAVGGLTTLAARSHTNSWTNALALGLCGAVLSMFFMTPQIISSKLLKNSSNDLDVTQSKKSAEIETSFLEKLSKSFKRVA